VVLGVLAGLGVSLAIAALSGARRADTAFARLTQRTTAADAVVFPSQVSDAGRFDWDRVRDLPYVEDVAPWNLTFGTLKEGTRHEEPHSLLFMPVDGHWLNTTDRPLVRTGRMWDPESDGEVLVDERTAAEVGISVGDRFTLHTYAAGQFAAGDPAGPMLDLEVVGVVRDTSQFLFTGMVLLSPGTLAAHPEMELMENAHVRLRHPAEDVPALGRDAAELLAPGTPILDLHDMLRRVSTAISLERVAQTLLGLAVAAAALVSVGQALWRSVSLIDDDAVVLRALGFTRKQRAVAATAPHLLTVVVAVPVALVGAWVLASRFPIGYARTVDPSIGHQIDWVVAGPAVVLTAVLIGAGAYAVAHLHGGRLDAAEAARPSAVATAARAHTPLAVGLGMTFAFEPGRGRRRVPVGPALLGAVAGVLGIVGTLTIDRGLQDALHNPERAGVTWDASVLPAGSDYGERADAVEPGFLDDLAASDDVDDVAVIGRAVLPVDEVVGIAFFDVKPVEGDIDLVVTDGAAPHADDEVALGPATADQLGVEIGDVVTVRGRSTRHLRVVGLALLPHEVHSGFTEGAWITPDLMVEIGDAYDVERELGTEQLGVVRWTEGVDPGVALAALQRRVGPGRIAAPAQLPPELLNLERVRSVPLVLLGFLVVFAIAALAHQLITSGNQRRRDCAVLRSIGFTRPMMATIVMSQSTCVSLVALLVGIPLGLALGRMGWSWVADAVPLVLVSPLAYAALALMIPITLVVAIAVAAYPARRIVRLGVAEALRTE
jgi:ABC-type lipoprotein release transport system permease subunit